jgi:Ni/Co efflux regulator RcnB
MKSKAIIFAIAAASLGFSAASLARDNDRRGDRDDRPRAQHSAQHHDQNRAQNRFENRQSYRAERREDRRDERRDERFDRRNDRHEYYNARRPEFRRGAYIPRDYRNRQYYITDYRAYHLSPPPRGHQWVQVGPDYVLIAIATGLIANIILNY